MGLVVMVCFPRSGGTLLNQCLGCLADTVILSEVSPFGCGTGTSDPPLHSLRDQARTWYGVDLKQGEFEEEVAELSAIVSAQGKTLIVRDWTYASFFPTHADPTPPRTLVTLDRLSHLKPISFALVRDAIDVWISVGSRTREDFASSCLQYARELRERDLPIFRYEDLTTKPETVIREICRLCNLRFSQDFRKYSTFTSCTGDVQVSGSRGRQQGRIAPLPRQRIGPNAMQRLKNSSDVAEANRLLGYDSSYGAADIERPSATLKRTFGRLRRKILRPSKVQGGDRR